jgi:sec-independent protein translocase protein TatB
VFDVGFFELVALAAIALFVFGPDKLPKFAADAGRMLRQLRAMAQGAKEEVTGALGPEFNDLNLSDLDPRSFVKRQLLEEGDDLERIFSDDPEDSPSVNGKSNGKAPTAGESSSPAISYDGDAT